MAIPKVIGNVTYSVPSQGQRGWGPDVTNLLARLADVANQVVTAQYILTTDNFFKDVSGQFGLKANFLKGVGAIAAADGFIRMANPYANPGQGASFPGGTPEGKSYTYLSWRNSTNSADLHLYPNNDNNTLQFAGHNIADVDSAQSFSNKQLDATNVINGLAITDGTLTNAKIASNAAIALSKLAALTINRLLVSDGSGVVSPSSVTATEAGYLSGVTSSIQTQLNGKATFNVPITPGTATKITYDANGFVTAGTNIAAADLPTGIDAAKIGAGIVSNTEFGYLDGVTSAIQTQLGGKQASGAYITALSGDVVASGAGTAVATIQSLAVTTGKIDDLAVTTTKINNAAVTDAKIASGINALKIAAGTVSNTEFGYLAGVTSAIQTQLNGKEPTITTLPIAKGGTGQTTANAAFNALSPATTKGDLIAFSTIAARLAVGTNGQYLKADSTTATGLVWADIAGGGSGSGEKNYIGNPNSATNWSVSGAGIAVTTESSQALLPDNVSQLTGLKFLRASGTDYAFYRFTLDAVDYNKKLKIVKDIKFAGAANDYSVRVFSNTASNYAGTSTELAVGPTSALPGNTTAQVSMSFDSSGTTAPYIEVRVYGNAGTTALYVNNFLVGPGVLGQVPAIGDWLTTTIGTVGGESGSALPGARKYRRVGDSMECTFSFAVTTKGAASGTLTIMVPAGLTIDGTKLAGGASAGKNSLGYGIQNTATFKEFIIDWASSTTVSFLVEAGGASLAWAAVANGDVISGSFLVPIAEWAGSGTVNLGAGAQPSYASNSSTSTANDTTSFQYGEAGASLQAFAPAGTAGIVKRVRCPYPNPKFAILQFKQSNLNWTSVAETQWGFANNAGDTVRYGAWLLPVSGSNTDYDVVFQNQAFNGQAWSTGLGSWRVVFADTPAAVGFGLATATDSGLVSSQDASTFTGSFTGAATQSITFTYSKLNKSTTVSIPGTSVVAAASTGLSAPAGTIPVALRPTANKTFSPTYYSIGGSGVAMYTVLWNADGSIEFRKEVGGLFASGTTYALNSSTFSYVTP